jgi:hypothetical protein
MKPGPPFALIRVHSWLLLLIFCASTSARCDVGDPQIGTDHPWYPGELACSTFANLFAAQAEQYHRATGIRPSAEQDKALASWFWRNTHYAHGEEGAEDLWGLGFTKGDLRTREYWTGLFAHGFGLCGTTHSQWTAEMEHLLGHGRARGVGVEGHNSFEVLLNDRDGRKATTNSAWSLLDHDISTVVFDAEGKRLLSIPEVKADVRKWTNRENSPQKQHGWLVCGLHPSDGSVYSKYTTAEYLAGYASVPPMVHLRRGETLRRYFAPGVEDGKTFVFWGRNYNTAKIPGPERSITWVNQPEKMHGSKNGAGYKPGQARYANAVYAYRPNFGSSDYREGIIDEADDHITFEFYTPYIVAATPPNDKEWGIYDAGCRNGLVLSGNANAKIFLSVDQSHSWIDCGQLRDGLDLTDHVKGRRQYLLRIGTRAEALRNSGLAIRTVCQANVAVLPRLKDNGCVINYSASRQAVVSAGPNKPQAAAHIIAGAFDSPAVTLELSSPRGERVTAVYAAAHVASGNPPSPQIKYQIEYSTDKGRTWNAIVKDWRIPRTGEEPEDFWSQSFCYGAVNVPETTATSVQVRFRNDGGKKYLRAEVHLVYRTSGNDPIKIGYAWRDSGGESTAFQTFEPGVMSLWRIETGRNVETRWVEMAVGK